MAILSKPFQIVRDTRDVVSVLDFTGVDPTGATDSSAGIQGALDWIAALANLPVPLESTTYSHSLYFPPGVYKVNTTLSVPNRVLMYGDGYRRVYIDGSAISSGAVIKSSTYWIVTGKI